MLTSFFLLFLAVSKNAESTQTYCNIFNNHSGGQHWKVVELAERDSKVASIPSKSNRETWKTNVKQAIEISSITPLKMQRFVIEPGLITSCYIPSEEPALLHCPWHVDIQLRWPEYSYIAKTLLYEVIHHPTIKAPHFVGRVCSMPNIQCKATSMGELEQKLLADYNQYLLKMLQDKDFIEVERNETPSYGVPLYGPLLAQPPLWFDNGYFLGIQFTF